MNWFTGIVVFLLIWWLAIFTVLPLGVRRDESTGTGAPENPQMVRKILMTTGLSVILWLCVYGLIEANIINFRDLAAGMAGEDKGP